MHDLFLLNIVLVVIVCLLQRYFTRHVQWGNQKSKRDLLIQTIFFSIAISYRAIINAFKLGYSTSIDPENPNDANPVEDLETNYQYLGFHQSMILLPILTMYL